MFMFTSVTLRVCVCLRVCGGYADCRVDHGWHINYRERYVAAVVGRDGTLIASKEDLSIQHGDICHSMGQCYPFLPSFCFSFTISL